MDYSIINNELLEALSNVPDNSFDGCFCDPPYEIGFMGKKWDGSGVAFQVETWSEVLRVLKPGAHLIAFGGTRTYHRLTCAIEDAGFEIRDSLMWVYGSGFPKSLDVSKAITSTERTGGSSPRNLRITRMGDDYEPTGQENYRAGRMFSSEIEHDKRSTILSKNGKVWQGYGTALKPAYEPCILARKPIEGTVAANCVKYGCGGLNIDGCRVPLNGDYKCRANGRPSQTGLGDNYDPNMANQPDTKGRFPANLIHDGSDEVVGLFPDSKGMSGGGIRKIKSNIMPSIQVKGESNNTHLCRCDSGSAARFFYTAKASKKERGERNNHPCVKPLSLCEYLSKLILPPVPSRLLVPFSGSGSEMMGALKAGWGEVVGIEREPEYVEIAEHIIENMKESVKTEEKGPIQGSLFEVEAA